jgi:hypothetical protein
MRSTAGHSVIHHALDLSAETPTLNFGLLPGIAHMLAIEGVLIKAPEGAKTEHRYQY